MSDVEVNKKEPQKAPDPKASKRKSKSGSASPARSTLTPSEKAEAAALWRAGTVTLTDLATKFKKRPETFSRMFKRMGIEKGSMVAAATAAAVAKVETKILSDVETQLRRIAEAKEENYTYARGLQRIAWQEIARARKADIKLDTLKDLMQTLKLAGDVFGNARKELYVVLGVEEVERDREMDDLPELSIRELSPDEIRQLQNPGHGDDGIENGSDELPELSDDELEG